MNSLRAIRLADLMRIVRLLRVLRVANTMRQWEMINVPNPWNGWKGSDYVNAFWVWIDGIGSKIVALANWVERLSFALRKEFLHFGKDGRSTLGISSKEPVHNILAFFFRTANRIGRWKKRRFPQRFAHRWCCDQSMARCRASLSSSPSQP